MIDSFTTEGMENISLCIFSILVILLYSTGVLLSFFSLVIFKVLFIRFHMIWFSYISLRAYCHLYITANLIIALTSIWMEILNQILIFVIITYLGTDHIFHVWSSLHVANTCFRGCRAMLKQDAYCTLNTRCKSGPERLDNESQKRGCCTTGR